VRASVAAIADRCLVSTAEIAQRLAIRTVSRPEPHPWRPGAGPRSRVPRRRQHHRRPSTCGALHEDGTDVVLTLRTAPCGCRPARQAVRAVLSGARLRCGSCRTSRPTKLSCCADGSYERSRRDRTRPALRVERTTTERITTKRFTTAIEPTPVIDSTPLRCSFASELRATPDRHRRARAGSCSSNSGPWGARLTNSRLDPRVAPGQRAGGRGRSACAADPPSRPARPCPSALRVVDARQP
jgi:hypothetical protein